MAAFSTCPRRATAGCTGPKSTTWRVAGLGETTRGDPGGTQGSGQKHDPNPQGKRATLATWDSFSEPSQGQYGCDRVTYRQLRRKLTWGADLSAGVLAPTRFGSTPQTMDGLPYPGTPIVTWPPEPCTTSAGTTESLRVGPVKIDITVEGHGSSRTTV